MAKTEHYYTKFEQDNFYHVYNRTVDRKPMFCNDGNCEFFMQRYEKYLSPVLDTYAWCLVGNHFHLLVRVRDTQDLTQDLTTFQKLSNLESPTTPPDKSIHDIVSHQFQMFFQSYAMAFNRQQNRIGTLFQTPFKRALVDSNEYLIRLVYYIHANPQLHGTIEDFRDWRWSSYFGILDAKPDETIKSKVLNWFGGKKQYEQYHAEKHQMIKNEKMFFDNDDNEIYITTGRGKI